MKWWGWLVITIGGSIMWGGLVLIMVSLHWISKSRDEEAILGGIIIICTLCVAIPLIQKAIKPLNVIEADISEALHLCLRIVMSFEHDLTKIAEEDN